MESVSSDNLSAWEQAYTQFETAEEEIAKFTARLLALGADAWPREARVVELFCGRGNGLGALERLGFRHLAGIDLSPTLVAQYSGRADCVVGDCRALPYADESKDILVVQGGLHHLHKLPDDVERMLAEARRVLRRDGRLVVVEPWLTPFLSFVHFVCALRPAHLLSRKVSALATMIEHERETYEQWLGQPDLILKAIRRSFDIATLRIRLGKLMLVGRPRRDSFESNPPNEGC